MDIIHVDGFSYNGLDYIAIRDQVSQFTWFHKLASTNTQMILTKLDVFMGIFGKSKKIISDNGPNLSSLLMETYCYRKWISHKTSAPHNPIGNGIVEGSVKLCKWALRRASLTKQSAHQLLRQRQSLWLSDCKASTQELFLKRRITPHHLSIIRDPETPLKKFTWKEEIECREAVRVERKKNLIKNSKTVKNYRGGDRVIIQDNDKEGR